MPIAVLLPQTDMVTTLIIDYHKTCMLLHVVIHGLNEHYVCLCVHMYIICVVYIKTHSFGMIKVFGAVCIMNRASSF